MTDITLYHADCLTVLADMPSESVDLIFADPPFNVGKDYGNTSDRRDDYYPWCARWIGECFRVLKPTGTFYLMTISRHLHAMFPLLAKHGVFISQVIWRNVSASHGKSSYWPYYQPILVYGKTEQYTFNTYAQTMPDKYVRWGGYSTRRRGQMSDLWADIPFVYAGSIKHKEAVLIPGTNKKAHPCQMPVALATRAILFSTHKGETVFDPFAGSGTVGVACIRTERNYIGVDTEEKFCQLAMSRFEGENQPDLFHPQASLRLLSKQ